KYMSATLGSVSRMHVRSLEQVQEAFAVAAVAEPAYVNGLEGVPSETRGNLRRMMGDAHRDLAGAGLGQAYGAAIKYLGGLAAIQSLFAGCGHECGCDECGCPKELEGLFRELRGQEDFCVAEKLAEADLRNKAAAIGDGEAGAQAIDQGRPSSFPVVPVVIGTLGVGIAIRLYLWLF